MSLPAVLIRKSTGEIIKHGTYPRLDMDPVDGLDPDLEWLLKYTPYAVPEYDPRVYQLITTQEVTTDPHPDYSHLNQFRITYATQKREQEEIEANIENAEQLANNRIIENQRQLKLMVLGLAVLFRKVEGLALNQKEQVIANRIVAAGTKLWNNDQVLRNKVAAYLAGQEPDIDEGWVVE
jgi:hypothetical protein